MITSLSNPHIKNIRRLRDKKYRKETGLYFIEGLRIVGEAFAMDAPIVEVIYAKELLRAEYGEGLMHEAQEKGLEITDVSKEVFSSISSKDGPQGIGVVLRQNDVNIHQINPQGIWVALDEIQDPGNLGTILRTNDAVGGEGIILLDRSTDVYDPAVIRGSMGAFFSQKIVRCSFQDFLTWKHNVAIQMVGTSDKAKLSFTELPYPKPVVLLMGSEREGLKEHHIRECEAVVRIPMVGRSDSLNLAVAASVVLYEIFHQQAGRVCFSSGGNQ